MCTAGWPRAVWDHVAIWKDEAGRLVFTSEPYDFDEADERFAEFCEALEDIGLAVDIRRPGLWFAGTTLLVVRRRADLTDGRT